MLATQRMSKLHKSAAAEANNVLIGRTALDVDVDRAARVLGFDRAKRELLRHLHPGEFFAFGPAISDQVIKVLVGLVDTSHPEAGQGAQSPAPAPAAIRQAIAQLKDIPREAQVERETLEGLRARVAELEREAADVPAPAPDRVGVLAEVIRSYGGLIGNIRAELAEIETALAGLEADAAHHVAVASDAPVLPVLRKADPKAVAEWTRQDKLPRPQAAVLDALAWFEQLGVAAPSNAQIAFVAGYTPTSGTFGNIRGRLHATGLVAYPGAGLTMLTAAGRERAVAPPRPATSAALQDAVLAKLDGPCRKVLEVILKHGASPPRAPLHSDDVAEQSGYSPGSGTFGNIRGRLRSLGLIDYPSPGYVAPADILYVARGQAPTRGR